LDPEAPHDGQAVYPHLDVVGDDDVDPAHDRPDPDGGLLFDEAGLTKIQFDPAHDRPGHVGLWYDPLTRAVCTAHHGKGHVTAGRPGPAAVASAPRARGAKLPGRDGPGIARARKVPRGGAQLAEGLGSAPGAQPLAALVRVQAAPGQRFPQPVSNSITSGVR